MGAWGRIRGFAKRFGRQRIRVHEKYVTRWARPAVSTALGVLYGPVASTAFTAITHYPHQAAAGVTMRAEGRSGLDARQKARAQAMRTSKYSLIGGGIGSLASGVVSGIAGENI